MRFVLLERKRVAGYPREWKTVSFSSRRDLIEIRQVLRRRERLGTTSHPVPLASSTVYEWAILPVQVNEVLEVTS
jgi:hypothetical protein